MVCCVRVRCGWRVPELFPYQLIRSRARARAHAATLRSVGAVSQGIPLCAPAKSAHTHARSLNAGAFPPRRGSRARASPLAQPQHGFVFDVIISNSTHARVAVGKLSARKKHTHTHTQHHTCGVRASGGVAWRGAKTHRGGVLK